MSTIPTPQDSQLLLQDTVTKTASFNSDGLDLGSGYSPGGPGQRMVAVIAVVSAEDGDGNETYSFTLQQSDDDSSYAACGTAVSATDAGVVLARGVVTKRYVRLALTAGGTTPAIAYKAWLNPLP